MYMKSSRAKRARARLRESGRALMRLARDPDRVRVRARVRAVDGEPTRRDQAYGTCLPYSGDPLVICKILTIKAGRREFLRMVAVVTNYDRYNAFSGTWVPSFRDPYRLQESGDYTAIGPAVKAAFTAKVVALGIKPDRIRWI